MASSPASPLTACTLASPAYLAHARVMAETFLEHHPEARVLLADLGAFDAEGKAREAFVSSDPRIETVHPVELFGDEAELRRLALAYSLQGLAGAGKPRLLRTALERAGGTVLLIDADIAVYRRLDDVVETTARHPVVVTPHLSRPLIEAEVPTLTAGVYNTGFVAVAGGAEPLLDWWIERTRRESVFRPARGMVWEQSWLGIAEAFFDLHMLRDPGINAMTRELLDQDISWRGESPWLGGRPLGCFHFSGPYDPAEPRFLLATSSSGDAVVHRRGRLAATELPWLDLERRPGAARLSREYAERLLAAGFEHQRSVAAPFSGLPGPEAIHRGIRDAYRTALLAAEAAGGAPPPNPFAGGDWDELIAWLGEPEPGDPDAALSRLMAGVWRSHAGAASVFPRIPGPDATAFLRWASRRLLPPPEAMPPGLHPRAARSRRRNQLRTRMKPR